MSVSEPQNRPSYLAVKEHGTFFSPPASPSPNKKDATSPKEKVEEAKKDKTFWGRLSEWQKKAVKVIGIVLEIFGTILICAGAIFFIWGIGSACVQAGQSNNWSIGNIFNGIKDSGAVIPLIVGVVFRQLGIAFKGETPKGNSLLAASTAVLVFGVSMFTGGSSGIA